MMGTPQTTLKKNEIAMYRHETISKIKHLSKKKIKKQSTVSTVYETKTPNQTM